jgi:hypothetical protein
MDTQIGDSMSGNSRVEFDLIRSFVKLALPFKFHNLEETAV